MLIFKKNYVQVHTITLETHVLLIYVFVDFLNPLYLSPEHKRGIVLENIKHLSLAN